MKSATERTGHGSDALSPWDLFMLGISLLVLVSLALEMLLPMEAETLGLLNRIDTVMCGFFLMLRGRGGCAVDGGDQW